MLAQPRLLMLDEQNTEMALRLADRTYVLEGGSEDLLQYERARKSYLGG
jgi:ABC-type branched-subunit amino acid transport system ATPase component